MATAVQMPKLGNTVEECLLTEWAVKVGDNVKEGDTICTIETDKASFDVPAPVGGQVLALLRKVDDLIPVLTDIAVIGAAGEDPAAAAPAASSASLPGPQDNSPAPVAEKTPAKQAADQPKPAAPAKQGSGVSPKARNMAASLGIDSASITGSGPNGRVVSADVKSAADSGMRMTPSAAAHAASTGLSAGRGTGVGGRVLTADLTSSPAPAAAKAKPAVSAGSVAYKGIRKLIGDRMMSSLLEHAQLTMHSSADATGLVNCRQALKSSADKLNLPKITLNDMVAYVLAQTLPAFPEVNGHFLKDKGTFERFEHVHLAVAVDTPRGLMVPVIRNANNLSLPELALQMADLAAKCKAGSIDPELLNGGTFTLTNLGASGVEYFTPILNAPQVGILGVGGISQIPVPGANGGIAWQSRIGLSLTVDHQVVDGSPAAAFLKALGEAIAAF